MKSFGCLGTLIFFAACLVISMVMTAVAFGIICAWFLHLPFAFGWHHAWDRPILLGVFSLWIGPFFIGRN